jgi:hypothetical protein
MVLNGKLESESCLGEGETAGNGTKAAERKEHAEIFHERIFWSS